MSNSGGELSRRKRIRHIINAAASIPFLATLNCILLAVWIYFALQSNEFLESSIGLQLQKKRRGNNMQVWRQPRRGRILFLTELPIYYALITETSFCQTGDAKVRV